MEECNVLIVGGGLAGFSAAKRLTELGVRDVVLIERMSGEHYEHYHHICGQAISERMSAMCQIDDSSTICKIDALKMECCGTEVRIPVKGRIIDRVKLLESMRGRTDARVVKDSVLSVRKDGDSFVVACTGGEYRCRYLIGADGAFSVVRKCLFGTEPDIRMPLVNNIVRADGEPGAIIFHVQPEMGGRYRWDFPIGEGLRSIGYVNGAWEQDGSVDKGIRFAVIGRMGKVTKGNCCLAGDSAFMANPICYGGIGTSLLAGRRVAEAIAKGNISSYQKWYDGDAAFNPHFRQALDTFSGWDGTQFADSIAPFRKGYSLLRGGYAILRRPRWANVYFSIWMAVRRGW